MRRISTSNGCRSFKSVDCRLRPRASETLLLAPTNFPFGEDQGSSANWLVLIFSTVAVGCAAVFFGLHSAVASGDHKCFARDPGRVGGREENRGASNVLRLSDSAQRRLRFDLFAHVALSVAGRICSFRLHHAGPGGIDTTSPRAQFRGERKG